MIQGIGGHLDCRISTLLCFNKDVSFAKSKQNKQVNYGGLYSQHEAWVDIQNLKRVILLLVYQHYIA